MIDKNFYLENLSAFDILIQDEDPKQAQSVIFRVYSMLQRDKIWLQNVATEEEIFDEDAELLEEVEEELKELDAKYDFRFETYYQLVQQEMTKLSGLRIDNEEDDFLDDHDAEEISNLQDDFLTEKDEDPAEDFYTENIDAFPHLSDEEIDLVPEYILESAKTRFNYPEFLKLFPSADVSSVEEEFLFPVIAGKAFGETDTEIAEKIFSFFTSLGYEIAFPQLLLLIAQKGKELGREILAFKVASDSLNQGAHPTAVIQQISQLLRGSI
ncbi:MAG: hypothetical protein L6264_06960 [Weeksellaceae bacterium]|nr:hypothetical protein [Bacteroidota bacterium]MCG2780671.1 hypothetical protein [Weeksellaceae bacterium]